MFENFKKMGIRKQLVKEKMDLLLRLKEINRAIKKIDENVDNLKKKDEK